MVVEVVSKITKFTSQNDQTVKKVEKDLDKENLNASFVTVCKSAFSFCLNRLKYALLYFTHQGA
jgi:hypothetical protein